MNDKNKLNKKYYDPENTGGLTKRLEKEQKLKEISSPDNTISDLSKKILATNLNNNTKQKKCSTFCRSEGFHILPLRYAITQKNASSMPANLGDKVKNISLTHSKYVVEMLDSGYVYQLILRTSGKKEWWAYKVKPLGYLSLFPIGKEAPVTVPEFACQSANHKFNGSVITVLNNPNDLEKTTYILYSHVELTQNKIKELENNPNGFASKGIWQKIDIAAWKGGTHSQPHCLNNTNLKSSIFNINRFGDRISQALKQFDALPNEYAGIALFDPIGISVNLNDYRNEAYISVDEFLALKDRSGLSNQRKLDAVQRIDTLKGSLNQKLENRLKDNAKLDADTRPYLDSRDQRKIDIIDKQIQAAQKRGDADEVKELQRSRQVAIEDHARLMKKRTEQVAVMNKHSEDGIKADFQTVEDNVDLKAVADFKKEVAVKLDNAMEVANQRAQDHLNWINSDSLLSALDIYDTKDLKNGCAFKAHVASLLSGMEGATASENKLDSWIKKPSFERENLFIRGLYSNQDAAKALHEQVVSQATDTTAVGIKTLKGVVDFLKKTDSAWDEWARVHTVVDKNDNPTKLKGNILFTGVEKRVMLFTSNLARAVFRAGMGTQAERVFVKAISQKLLFVQMGDLAEKLRFDELVHRIDPEKQSSNSSKLSPEFAQRVGPQVAANAKAATLNSLDVLIDDAIVKKGEFPKKIEAVIGKDMKDATNNYHQVRASGILVLLEVINLTTALESGKYKNIEQVAALVASVSGLFAFGLDIFYGLAKGVREVAAQSSYTAAGAASTRGAANIQRGAIKFAAVGFSTVAGCITAWLDFSKSFEFNSKVGEVNKSLSTIYFTRGLSGSVGAFLGIFAALTYLDPVVNYVSRIGKSPAITRMVSNRLVKKLTKDFLRVLLLRGIAWASGIGLILTAMEVSYLIYIELTKLQDWCEYCTFRKNKSKKIMSEKQEVEDFQQLLV